MKQRDAYNNTGCFNMDCHGFVPGKGAGIAPGAIITPVSAVNGPPPKITIKAILVIKHMLFTKHVKPNDLTKCELNKTPITKIPFS
jgi:hypothetical protein